MLLGPRMQIDLPNAPPKSPLTDAEKDIADFMLKSPYISYRYKMGEKRDGKTDWQKFAHQFGQYAQCMVNHAKQSNGELPEVFKRPGSSLKEKIKYLKQANKLSVN